MKTFCKAYTCIKACGVTTYFQMVNSLYKQMHTAIHSTTRKLSYANILKSNSVAIISRLFYFQQPPERSREHPCLLGGRSAVRNHRADPSGSAMALPVVQRRAHRPHCFLPAWPPTLAVPGSCGQRRDHRLHGNPDFDQCVTKHDIA